MTLRLTKTSERQIKKLSTTIRKKLYKQFFFLQKDYHHPSLHTQKMSGFEETFEARIDRHYRFTYLLGDSFFLILSVGPHDEGLGKK